MADKYLLPRELVALQWHLLPLRVHSTEAYRDRLEWTGRALAMRDPEDVHALALAATLDLPLWSNDRDLHGHGIETCPLPGCCGTSRGPSEVDPRLGLVRGRHAIRHAA
jgi:hypothetical protein